ncbi:MAG: hypothetical protein WA981_03460 [Glaciecola sp.]
MHDLDKLKVVLNDATAIVVDGEFHFILCFHDDDELLVTQEEDEFTLQELLKKKMKVFHLVEIPPERYKVDCGGQLPLC